MSADLRLMTYSWFAAHDLRVIESRIGQPDGIMRQPQLCDVTVFRGVPVEKLIVPTLKHPSMDLSLPARNALFLLIYDNEKQQSEE